MRILLVESTGTPFHEFSEEHVEKIRAVDPNVEVVKVSALDQEKIDSQIEHADVLAGTFWESSPIHDVKNLKWIHSFSAGVERVLTPEVKDSNVLVGNCSGIHAIPIAEHILGFMLLFTRCFSDTFRQQEEKVWERSKQMTELYGKTVLIVGLGHIGKEAARLASCVGTRILAVEQQERETPDFVEKLYSPDQLMEALPKADFVVCALPYTSTTHHLFDSEKFRIMKQSAVFINISRGGVVHEKELIKALREKDIAGAALDVTEVEPLAKDSPLWEMENVVITPHHSGLSEKYMDRAVEVFCVNLQAYIKGERLPNLVDKQKGY